MSSCHSCSMRSLPFLRTPGIATNFFLCHIQKEAVNCCLFSMQQNELRIPVFHNRELWQSMAEWWYSQPLPYKPADPLQTSIITEQVLRSDDARSWLAASTLKKVPFANLSNVAWPSAWHNTGIENEIWLRKTLRCTLAQPIGYSSHASLCIWWSQWQRNEATRRPFSVIHEEPWLFKGAFFRFSVSDLENCGWSRLGERKLSVPTVGENVYKTFLFIFSHRPRK